MTTTIGLTEKELRKLTVIKQLAEGSLTQTAAAESLGISDRQVRRLLTTFRNEGSRGFASKLRGKPSNHQLREELKEKAVQVVKDKYPDFGPTFAAEKLLERENLKITVSTLRRAMIDYGVWDNKKHKQPVHRTRRPRKPCYGDMEQFDGSLHDWFEGRYQDNRPLSQPHLATPSS